MAYDLNKIYPLKPFNWYKIYPYGFSFRGKNGERTKMWLPINPSNLNITTHFATNIVTTLYGIVEEHSEVRYYDIVIQGTTGFSPQNYKPEGYSEKNYAQGIKTTSSFVNEGFGRASFKYDPLLSLNGFAQPLVGVFNQINDVKNTMINGTVNESGISPLQTGYTAFHNLYRYLMTYKQQVGGERGKDAGTKRNRIHGLMFLNYKDGTKYECVPKTFTLTRSAESPMLYNYVIVLRAYNLRGIDGQPPMQQEKLERLGLGGISGSAFSQMKDLSSSARTVVGGLKSVISG